MEYCFLDVDVHDKRNSIFSLQKKYAERIGETYCIDLKAHEIYDKKKEAVGDLSGKEIMLRCSYDYYAEAIRLLLSHNARLLETEKDINKIENWQNLNIAKRTVQECTISRMLSGSKEIKKYLSFLGNADCLFVKSKHKGFSAVIELSCLMDMDMKTVLFLEKMKKLFGDELLISRYQKIKSDSFGPRESRHFVIKGQLINSSRNLHSIRHTVPKSQVIKAKDIIDCIGGHNFPQNYVLDIGEFCSASETYIDIVEINPVTTSFCYVNNSIFTKKISEIAKKYDQYRMGYEYCYDALENPQKYFMNRAANQSYTYTMENGYQTHFFHGQRAPE